MAAEATVNLPLFFQQIPPEAQAFADIRQQRNDLARRKKDADFNGRDLHRLKSLTTQTDEARTVFWQDSRAITAERTQEQRRELAGIVLSKIATDAKVVPPHSDWNATISRACYTGQVMLNQQPYFWTTILDAWHRTPPDGGDPRPLTFDEYVELYDRRQADLPYALNENKVVGMRMYLNRDRYTQLAPQWGTVHPDGYAFLQVSPSSMALSVDFERTGAFPETLAVPMTSPRLTELGQFITGLEKAM